MRTYKKIILAGAFLGLAGSAVQAADMDPAVPATTYENMGFYLRADVGWSFLDWSEGNDNNWAAGVGAGYRFNDNLRVDGRFDYAGQYHVAPGADMSVTTALANAYFDIPTGTAFTPYLGAGVGYGWGTVDGGSDKDGFAYALMAGVGVNLSDSVELDVGYRFRNIMASGADPMEHQILTGIRFGF